MGLYICAFVLREQRSCAVYKIFETSCEFFTLTSALRPLNRSRRSFEHRVIVSRLDERFVAVMSRERRKGSVEDVWYIQKLGCLDVSRTGNAEL